MWATAGSRLDGRYLLEAQLGKGGMGAVWRARDLALGRTVAIKIVDSPGDRRLKAESRLRREARLLGGLTHPNLVQVYDCCETDEGAFIVMELVEGESLAARLARDGRLAPGEAAAIAALCAGALDAAHLAGVVHRDVKPSNIMLSGANVKIIDFGVAATTDPTDTTGAFGLFGTVAYLAPERATGAPATPAADLYALGVVLYQMLAGRLPFVADESISMLYAHTATSPIPLPLDVPPPLAEVCLYLLAKEPGMRPATGRMAQALLEAAPLDAPAVRPASVPAHAPEHAHEQHEHEQPEPSIPAPRVHVDAPKLPLWQPEPEPTHTPQHARSHDSAPMKHLTRWLTRGQ